MPGYANPQALNRYSYVLGNPIRYTDPTGHMLDDGCKDYGCDFGTSSSTLSSSTYVPTPTPQPDPDDGGDLLDPNADDDETVTLPIPTVTPSSGPNWGKIAAGIGIIVVVDLLIVAPLVVGLTAFAPELEVAMILTEAWSWPLVGAVVAANVYGWNLIVEGAKGN